MLEVTQQGREAMAKTIAAQRGGRLEAPAPVAPLDREGSFLGPIAGGPFVPAPGESTVVAGQADRLAYGHALGESRVPAAAGHSGDVLDQHPRVPTAQVTHTLPILAANPANATSADARMGPPSVTAAVIDNRGPAAVGAVLPPSAFTVSRDPHTAPTGAGAVLRPARSAAAIGGQA